MPIHESILGTMDWKLGKRWVGLTVTLRIGIKDYYLTRRIEYMKTSTFTTKSAMDN